MHFMVSTPQTFLYSLDLSLCQFLSWDTATNLCWFLPIEYIVIYGRKPTQLCCPFGIFCREVEFCVKVVTGHSTFYRRLVEKREICKINLIFIRMDMRLKRDLPTVLNLIRTG